MGFAVPNKIRYSEDMLHFGLRAHDFGCLPVETLADKIQAFGPASVQLAPSKAFPGIPASQGYLNAEFAKRVKKVFATRGMTIAVVGCYINPVHPDADELERQLCRFEESLRYARDFGCSLVGTETGSLNPDSSWHPGTREERTFDRLCVSVERLVRVAEHYGSIVALEPVADKHTVSSIERTQALIKRIDSPALGIIFDPVNLIPQTGLEESQAAFFERAFDAFGSRIVAIHAKDFRVENGRKLEAVAAGLGQMDFATFFRLLQARKSDIDVLLENVSPATAAAALAFVRRIATEMAIPDGIVTASP